MNDFYLKVYLFFNGICIDTASLVKNADPRAVAVCFFVSAAGVWAIDRYVFKKGSVVYSLIAGAYLTFLLSVTVLGRVPELSSSWDGLFHTYAEALNGNDGMKFDILFNVILYVPVGLLSARCRDNTRTVVFILLLSAAIEFVQLFTSLGIFELSDVINNFVGGAAGLFLARMAARLSGRIKNRRENSL